MDLKWLLYTMVALLLGGETGGKCPKLTSFSGGECGGQSMGEWGLLSTVLIVI